ncbi:hypothetical protein OJF2_26370 [Aquisphaera giovannonii]|uniref:Uncharacterized protein n=1 Tax=Aquisphaera giovannonii TaxID=406548 RepID=A0A5B9W0N4_9BACT|nr:hypothetical protein [Aquisphaera giovannonii]QEH34103.1 hypothetical protein OJF2_26370 [Aquisphaera giovannonii]
MKNRPARSRGMSRRVAALALALALALAAPVQGLASEPVPGVPWPATDAAGRSLPVAGEPGVPGPRPGRTVAMFYFLWHNDPRGMSPPGSGPFDVSRILGADPDALRKPTSPPWGPFGAFHYWGEPLYGYYFSADAWVLRRHAALLSAAGVDALIFDATNAVTYRDVYRALCAVFADIRRAGGRTPGIAFMVNTHAGKTAQSLYEDLYWPGDHRDLWFLWEGKPLLLCDPKEASPEVRAFFTLRAAHWPFTQVDTPFAWHWEATYPQHYGYTTDPGRPEQVSVSVAQNLRVSDGQVTNMSSGDARGRSFHDGRMERSPGATDLGLNVQEQWKRAIELDPPLVMVTGWNEWIAGRYGESGGPVTFVDQFSREYSRDIEPMKGGHGDNYYYQLVANVRRYKGASPLPKASAPRTIEIGRDLAQWRSIEPEFLDGVGDAEPRDFDGAGGLRYRDGSGRNDIVACKVARDSKRVTFLARTRRALTPSTDPNWMWLLIDADHDPKTGWEGYDYLANRNVGEDGMTSLERNLGGWRWERVAKVGFRATGDSLQLTIPREALGIPAGSAGFSLDFKWADNLAKPGEVMDFYTSGDVAPEGRFRFRYVAD